LSPISYIPSRGVIIDPVNLSTQANAFSSFTGQVFVFDEALYAVLAGDIYLLGTIQVAKSTDNGQSWSFQDETHAPAADPSFNNNVYYQKGNIVYVGLQSGYPPPQAILFYEFNLTTDLWQTSSIGTITITEPLGLVVRDDDSVVLVTADVLGAGSSGWSAFVWDGSSWNAGTDLGAQYFSSSWYVPDNFGVDIPHFCTDGVNIYFSTSFSAFDFPLLDQFVIAVSFTGDAVVNSFIFPDNSGSMPPRITTGVRSVNGWPCLIPSSGALVLPMYLVGSLVTPMTPNYPSLFVSFDGGATWALLGAPGVDPTQYASVTGNYSMTDYAPSSVTDGTNLYLVYGFLGEDVPTTLLRVCTTTAIGTDPSTWTWTCITVQDIVNYPGYKQFQTPFLTYTSGQFSLLLAGSLADHEFRYFPMFFFGTFTLPIPVGTAGAIWVD
jgi:hypothetical protein